MGLQNLFNYGKQAEQAPTPAAQVQQSQGDGVVSKGAAGLNYLGVGVSIASLFTKVPQEVVMAGKTAAFVGSLQKASGVSGAIGAVMTGVCSVVTLRPEVRLIGKGLTLLSGLKNAPSQDAAKVDQIGYASGMLPTALGVGIVALETIAPFAPALVPAIPVIGQIVTATSVVSMGYNIGREAYKAYTAAAAPAA